MKGTSEAVNEVVEVIRKRIAALQSEVFGSPAEARDADRSIVELSRVLVDIENNRLGALVAVIAGRRGLEKLPAYEREKLIAALAGIESPKTDKPGE